jgi:hypothetical protein
MADYAKECSYDVSDEEIDACVEAQSDPEDPSVCREYGNAQQIRDEWTCEDLGLYFPG